MKMKAYIFNLCINLCPKSLRLSFLFNYSKAKGKIEPEIIHLKNILAVGKRAIDVGGNQGFYTYALSQLCTTVEVFEPQPHCAENINHYKNSKCDIKVHPVALSDTNGSLSLHIPVLDGQLRDARASFREIEGEKQSINVPIHRLDDYNFKEVSFIKIDVEGHEINVIRGAKETIIREKPVLLIEIEQRHLDSLSIEEVFKEITSLGYKGSYLKRGHLISLSEFSYERDQKPFLKDSERGGFGTHEEYVNNFFFMPVEI
jgi:FkbM family methyltransferase